MLSRRMFSFGLFSVPFLKTKNISEDRIRVTASERVIFEHERHSRIEVHWEKDLKQWTISCPDFNLGIVSKDLNNTIFEKLSKIILDKLGKRNRIYWSELYKESIAFNDTKMEGFTMNITTSTSEHPLGQDGKWYNIGWVEFC